MNPIMPNEKDMYLSDRLNEWQKKSINIRKEQNRDIDEISMTLEVAGFHDRPESIDGYVSSLVLQLHGEGSITSEIKKEDIPYHTYEIPIDGHYDTIIDQRQIQIKTDDASYTINVQENRLHDFH